MSGAELLVLPAAALVLGLVLELTLVMHVWRQKQRNAR